MQPRTVVWFSFLFHFQKGLPKGTGGMGWAVGLWRLQMADKPPKWCERDFAHRDGYLGPTGEFGYALLVSMQLNNEQQVHDS